MSLHKCVLKLQTKRSCKGSKNTAPSALQKISHVKFPFVPSLSCESVRAREKMRPAGVGRDMGQFQHLLIKY